ncbi:tRNA lysidine(34) synthetase TilS [Pedobacter sp. Du54]|uniref:tRNA lysidine(34) synthetase TilS n=1 Tax=Pedobacter anseongensis TaxID=3133439 RepID=UPI0030A55158
MLPASGFIAYIKKNALFTQEDNILLAISGGKDSVLMAQLFKLTGFKFSIAHCNFNLRGDESQRDEAFVRLLAHTLDVPFYTTHFDTKAYAKANHVSTQMAARDLRYRWFEELRLANGYDYIALAHHQNDSIETLLLNLTRGTGISGMHGILPKRDYLVRPLLFLSRQQIEALVEEHNIDYVEDSSNLTDTYARNNIRLNVIPVLKEINPNLEETFARNFIRFAETEAVLQQVVEQTRQNVCEKRGDDIYFSIEKIVALSPQKLLFFELLKPYQFTSSVVDEILSSLAKQSGTSFYSPNYRATINRTDLVISPIAAIKEDIFFMHPHDEYVGVGEKKLLLSYSHSISIDSNANKAFVDADKLIFPLVIRFKQDGDKFMPLGMKHYKKLSDFFIDQKVAIPHKSKIPLLINGNGEIIWVVGFRQDNRYKVKVTTKKVAIFEC